MATQQHQEVWSSAETAVSRVALSLDSLFVNGLLYGVIHGDAFNDFLQKPAEVLLRDVANLETKGAEASVTSGVGELLSHLRAKCRQVIEHLTSLRHSGLSRAKGCARPWDRFRSSGTSACD